jgi:hypothetical protein
MKKKEKIQFLESYLRRTSKTIDYCYFDSLVSLEDILRVSGGLLLARKTIQGNFSTYDSKNEELIDQLIGDRRSVIGNFGVEVESILRVYETKSSEDF